MENIAQIENIIIKIKTAFGNTFELKVNPLDTIKQVKQLQNFQEHMFFKMNNNDTAIIVPISESYLHSL